MIHTRIFEIDHHEYGFGPVGSECFRELMGWSWRKSHENAVEMYFFLKDWLTAANAKWGTTSPYILVQYADGKKAHIVAEAPVHWRLRHDPDVEEFAPHEFVVRMPHGFNTNNARAGLDIRLWEHGVPKPWQRFTREGHLGLMIDFSIEPPMTGPLPVVE
jgi:hypothetical protein